MTQSSNFHHALPAVFSDDPNVSKTESQSCESDNINAYLAELKPVSYTHLTLPTKA